MVKKIYYIFDHHQRVRIIILLVMIFIGALFETVGVSAILPLITAVMDPTIIDTNDTFRLIKDFLGIEDYRLFILVMTLTLIAIYIVKNSYLIMMTNALNHFITNNQRRLSVKMVSCYLAQDYLFHTEHNVAEIDRNVGRDVEWCLSVVQNLLQLMTEILVCIMLGTYLLITDFSTTIFMVALLSVCLLLFTKAFKKRLRKLGEETRSIHALKTKCLLEAFGGIKELKSSSNEFFFVDKYEGICREYAYATQKQQLLAYLPKPVMESMCICGLLFFMAIRIVMGEDISKFIPVLSVFAVATIRMLPSFNRISGQLSNIMYNKAGVDSLYSELKKMENYSRAISKDEETIEIPSSDISIENLSFSYPSKPDKKIIDDVSFVIPRNKSVAFVGPSGAGKTTLSDIIIGVLKPDEGKIIAGNINVLDNLASWHKRIGYIPQSIFLTDDSIRSNVAFGIPENEIDDDKVWRALEEAQIIDFVKNQKDGIYTNIGEHGMKVSGGQRQRIGIARALYLDPELIVLDEATSALDNDTEKAVMDAIYRLSGKKTMIIIAHRLTTISNCDFIYEIKDGKAKMVDYDDLMDE